MNILCDLVQEISCTERGVYALFLSPDDGCNRCHLPCLDSLMISGRIQETKKTFIFITSKEAKK
jgi:hypothetical protein